jgi:hypothetical protein
MKALLATIAIVVIGTCGYFVYDDYQSKAAEAKAVAARAKLESRVNCLSELKAAKEMLKDINMWDGKTHKERMEASILPDYFDYLWRECG